MLKQRLRRFIVWSSFPPFVSVYRGIYRLVIQLSLFVLRRYRGIISIYLCRGCAKNEIIPGISDIDFVLVTTNDSEERRSIKNAFRAMGKSTFRLIDYYPSLVTSKETLEHRWRTSPAWQYRYLEGKTTWKLLYGTDVLSSLPKLNEAQLSSASYNEMFRWWLTFAHQLLGSKSCRQDIIMRNVVCYKTVSELLNSRRALERGEYLYVRAAGLTDSEDPLLKKLAAVAEKRFLPLDEGLMDETLHFLTSSFLDIWDRFKVRPFLHIHNNISQHVDYPKSEIHLGEQEKERLAALYSHIEERLGRKCEGIHLVKSAFWDMEDHLIVIKCDRENAPNVRELADIAGFHKDLQQGKTSRFFLFFRLGPIAFPITPEMPKDMNRGLLTPATMPDVFIQMGDTEVYWTDYTKWYLADWQANEQWTEASPHKKLQLELISRSAERGSIIYPLTLEALERAAFSFH
jgi:hypothetical protein